MSNPKTPGPDAADEDAEAADCARILETALHMLADGELTPTEGEAVLDRLLEKAASPKRRPS